MAELFLNINTLVLALKGLKEKSLLEDRDLYDETREVFRKLNLLSDFNEKDLQKIIQKLEALPPEIKEKDLRELEGGQEKKLESDLSQKKLEELIETYEKSQDSKEKEKISREIYLRTGEKDVALFIEKQRELAAEKLSSVSTEKDFEMVKRTYRQEGTIEIQVKLEKEIKTESEELEARIKEEKTKQVVKEATKSENFNEKILVETLKRNLIDPKEIKKVVAEVKKIRKEKEKTEKINTEIKKAIYEEKNDLRKKLEEKYEKNSNEIQEILRKVDQVKAEIKVEAEAKKIVEKVFEKLKEESLPINENSQLELKQAILNSWENNEKLVLPKEIEGLTNKTTVVRELLVSVDKFKKEELVTIINFRASKLEEKVTRSLRESGVQNEELIAEYTAVLSEFYNDSNSLVAEINIDESVNFVRSMVPQASLWQAEESVREAQFLAKNLVKSPKRFNTLLNRYNLVRDKIGIENLPKVEEARVTEKITNFLSKSPQTLKLLGRAQRIGSVVAQIQGFPKTLFLKGTEKVSGFVFEKIGNQAMASFVQNSAAVIAKEGSTKGITLILKSVLSKGAVVAGETAAGGAAGGGALAGAVAAFQALPVVGQVIAVVTLVVTAVVVVAKSVIKTLKGLVEKILGTKLNQIQRFLSEDLGLGKFAGKVGQFLFDLWMFLVGIPKMLRLLKTGAVVSPVIGFFFIGTFAYTLFQHQQVSSIVPPTDLSGCILKRGSGPGGTAQIGEVNCDPNAPENEVPGLRGGKANYVRIANQWWSGKNYAEECFNDVVNRSLCAGINPLYSLWAWVHESGASNYDHGNVQDFGINDSSIENNFDAQIKIFLNLDPASACDLSDPKLSGPDGYWLAWASRYLTGQCDPDVGQAQTGNTGREYFNDMKNKTWDWIASVPIPKDIYVEKGGKNCEQAGAPLALTGPTKEIIGDDGQVYICSTGGSGGPSMISPGGAPVAGSITQCPFDSFSHGNSWAIDWGAPFGTPIYSTFSGIARLGEGNGYGFYVDIHSNYNGDDFFIRYAHMPPGGYTVGDGEAVAAGQQIGIVDNTGFSTGNHLHYQVFGANIDWDNAGPYFGLTQEEFNSACR